MPCCHSMRHVLAVFMGVLAGAATAASVQPPFNDLYQLRSIPAPNSLIPGVPAPYGGLAFAPNSLDTLLIIGNTHNAGSDANPPAIYAIKVSRDAKGHINGFKGTGKKIAAAPGLSPNTSGGGHGLAEGPEGVLFYTSVDGSLGMIKRASDAPDRQIDLPNLAPTPISEAMSLAFVPPGFAGGKSFKVVTGSGRFFAADVSPDGTGTFDLANVREVGLLTDMGLHDDGVRTMATGLAYVAAGNPRFPAESVLAMDWDFNAQAHSDLSAYRTDGEGNPILSSRRVVVSDFGGSAMTVDPVTGDLVVGSFWIGPGLVMGFSVPPLPSYSKLSYGVAESANSVKIVVKRGGSLNRPISVNYATATGAEEGARYAVPGVNFTPVQGTLNWAAGDKQPKSFVVPVISDGVFNTSLKVDLNLSLAEGGELLPAAALYIANQDPKPTVNLSNLGQTVEEGAGTVNLTATLSQATPLPVTVPLVYSGTATLGQDYRFLRDANKRLMKSIVFPPNTTQVTLPLKLINDQLTEPDETIIVTLGKPVNANPGAATTDTLTIQDND